MVQNRLDICYDVSTSDTRFILIVGGFVVVVLFLSALRKKE